MTPAHYRLDLDWNGMPMNVGTATPVLRRLDQYERVSIYGGPINQADVEGQRELRRNVARPIAIHFGQQLVGTGLVTALAAHLGAVLPPAQWPTITCLNNYTDDLLVEALTRYAMAPPYRLPDERHILSVVWPGGRVVQFADMPHHCWPHFRQHGNDPAQEPGATLEICDEDGSTEWAERYQRLQAGPLREQRG